MNDFFLLSSASGVGAVSAAPAASSGFAQPHIKIFKKKVKYRWVLFYFKNQGLKLYSDIFKMAAGTMPTTFAVPNTAGWDLDQLLPSESVVTGWKWDYGVTPLSDITVSIKTRCLPPSPLPRFFLPFFS